MNPGSCSPDYHQAQSASAPIQTIQSVNDAEKFDPSHENNNHCRPPAGPCWAVLGTSAVIVSSLADNGTSRNFTVLSPSRKRLPVLSQ